MKRASLSQVPTVPTTIQAVMSNTTFERGVNDLRAGRGFPHDYDTWSGIDDCWDYERGRQWARLVPRHVKLKDHNGKVTTQALRLFAKHSHDIR